MTQVASRTDFQYLLAFITGFIVTFTGGPLVSTLLALIPPVTVGERSFQELQATSLALNSVGIVAATLVYGLAFVGFAVLLKRYTAAEPTRTGIYAGAVVASALMMALMLTAVNVSASYVRPDQVLNPDLSVWADILGVAAVGAFYVFGWFIANHLGQVAPAPVPAKPHRRRKRS